jgi:Fe-S-cluster containining protein
MSVVDEPLDEAFRRRDLYTRSIDPALSAREDAFPRKLRAMNASAPAKLRQIYALVDELTAAAGPYIACGKGCAACCHMNVTISELEAKTIARAAGRNPVQLRESRSHELGEFSGVPCPFLKDSVCSIYADRPYACRKHVSFDTSDFWCRPERSHETELPQVGFSGPEDAFFELSRLSDGGIIADIRDFFPQAKDR